jgi:hypothetical protein
MESVVSTAIPPLASRKNVRPIQRCLEEALTACTGDRQESYGSAARNHETIACIWNGYLEARNRRPSSLTGTDVANLMELLKVARRLTGAHNEDDYIDGAGYAAVALECAEEALGGE